VAEQAQLRDLPLAGRDVYALLVTLPAVTTDTSTGRGLGLSAAGNRPSASNFLLDGLDNNNHLITGPLVTMAPEAVQEYRVSVAGFTAEYGRTSGFLANVVTRPGGNQWHGLGYFYFKNEFLNATEFQRNRLDFGKRPLKEMEPGFSVSGPLRRDRAFASAAFERLRFRSIADGIESHVPPPGWAPRPGTYAARLWSEFPNHPAFPADGLFHAPAVLNRTLVLPRIDYVLGGGEHRVFARAAVARLERPDFIASPYRDFSSPLTHNSIAPAAGYQGALRPGLIMEARAGWSYDDLRFDRAHPEVPRMASEDRVELPGSPAAYSFRNRTRAVEFLGNVLWMRGRHVFKAGAGALRRRLDGYLGMEADGYYAFERLEHFGEDRPVRIGVSLDRLALASGVNRAPDFDREYGITQFHFFAQDSVTITPRLTLNFGLRYESVGAPRIIGAARDVFVVPGPEADWAARLSSARLERARDDQLLHRPDRSGWAPRAGFAYDLRGDSRTLLRGSYGLYLDRPFDNLWQNLRNNSFVLSTRAFPLATIAPVRNVLPLIHDFTPDLNFSRLTFYDQDLRMPRVHSFFVGVAQQLGRRLWFELDGIGSAGRRLIATDILNRDHSAETAPGRWARFRTDWPNIWHRSNLGKSDYYAMSVAGRYRGHALLAHVAYTWSHSIDNQSEALAGDFFDLLPTRPGAAGGSAGRSAFSEQFNASIDRGSSDFDQRHNLVFFSVWDIPMLRGWKFSQLMAIRSGFPYTVFARARDENGPTIENRRADLIQPRSFAAGEPVPGGRRLLRSAAFAQPDASRQGTSGRNAFRAPGHYSLDVSASRSFRVSETARLVLRGDAFNVLNHANLGTPGQEFGFPGFGEAHFGRIGTPSPFPALTPFVETARQVQLMLRFEF
jgi:hypothetical protein